MWVIPLQISWQIWGHVRKRNIVGGREFSGKILSLQRERTPCGQDHRIWWTGAVDFPRIYLIFQMQTTQLGEFTRAIAHSAAKMGFCKKTKNRTSNLWTTRWSECAGCAWNVDGKRTCGTEDSLHRTAQSTTKDETEASIERPTTSNQ